MLFAFTLAEIHVLLPDYKKIFLVVKVMFCFVEIYYSFGAIFSGLMIIRLFKNVKTVYAVIILMSIARCHIIFFLILTFYGTSLGDLVIESNAGVRILRTTYIFHHVPNNLIGRTNSVFGT